MALTSDPSRYWDRVADAKVFSHPFDATALGAHVTRSGRLLEVGCGYGRVLDLAQRHGWRGAIGLDSSAGMVARGRTAFPQLDLRHHAGGRLPFDAAGFDAVLLFAVLTCIPEPGQQEALLAEVARVLVPGGVLYVSDLLLQEDARNRERYAAGLRRHGVEGVFDLPEGVTLCHFTRARIDRLTAAFEPLGFAELEVTTMNGNAARGFQLLARRPV